MYWKAIRTKTQQRPNAFMCEKLGEQKTAVKSATQFSVEIAQLRIA
jgi:hypothetical protein